MHHEPTSWFHFLYKLGLPDWVPEFVPISYFVIILLGVTSYLVTRKMEKIPTGIQNVLEYIVESLHNFTVGIIGPHGSKYSFFIGSLFLYILSLNLIGLIPGMLSPTASLNTTLALSITTFFVVQYSGINANGIIGYIKHLMGEPIWLAPLMFPIHIVGELSKPISLAVRLFGNIFGEDTIIVIFIGLSPVIFKYIPLIPVQFPMVVFAVFTSFVQALVFAILACVYITLLTAHEEHEKHIEHKKH